MNIQYVTDDKGNPIAVQIPLDQWEIIKAELDSWDGEVETTEIISDSNLLDSIRKGREQARRKIGRRIDEIGLPEGATIATIIRSNDVIIAHHDTLIEAEDHLILFALNKRIIPKVEKLLQVGFGFF